MTAYPKAIIAESRLKEIDKNVQVISSRELIYLNHNISDSALLSRCHR